MRGQILGHLLGKSHYFGRDYIAGTGDGFMREDARSVSYVLIVTPTRHIVTRQAINRAALR